SYDPEGAAEDFVNLETVLTCGVGHSHWEAQLKGLIERHAAETGSKLAARILSDWPAERANFLQVCPTEMVPLLSHPLSDEPARVPAEWPGRPLRGPSLAVILPEPADELRDAVAEAGLRPVAGQPLQQRGIGPCGGHVALLHVHVVADGLAADAVL